MKPKTKLALELIARREGACPTSFLHHGVGTRYGARLAELRDAGFEIVKSRCEAHDHDSYAVCYRLVQPAESLLDLIDPGYSPGSEPFGDDPAYQARMAGVRSFL